MKKMIGYRFHPTDEELINHYLGHIHFRDEAVARNVINEIDVCGSDPWELPSLSKIQYDEDDEQNVWYFFSESSKRGKRTTKNGYWKPTGKDREIRVNNQVIDTNKGRNPNGKKKSCVIPEYHPSVTPPDKRAQVLCKLKNKAVENNPEPSSDGVEAIQHPLPPDPENHIDATSEVKNSATQQHMRFYPTDEEIFNHYLQNMNFGNESLARNVINEIDMSIFDPWEMPSRSKIQSDDDGDEQNVWFFFCHSGWSSKSSRRAKSAAKSGYWKPAGRDREIRVDHEVIGTRKTLVFYKGRNPRAEKTSWVVHVYHPSIKPPNKTAYVLCKLKKKGDEKDPVPSSDVNNLANLSLSRGERVVQSEDPVS